MVAVAVVDMVVLLVSCNQDDDVKVDLVFVSKTDVEIALVWLKLDFNEPQPMDLEGKLGLVS